jgi:hypothetical protein
LSAGDRSVRVQLVEQEASNELAETRLFDVFGQLVDIPRDFAHWEMY